MNAVVVVAGGSGRRMGGAVPKQFLELRGEPVIIHTLKSFFQYDPQIKMVLVLAGNHRKFWDEIAPTFPQGSGIVVVAGGKTRYDSVKNGLKMIDPDCIVGIHDAVRPLVSRETISRSYKAAAETGSGIPVIEMDESVRRITEERGSENLERANLRRVQTPQVFKSEQIIKAYDRECDPSFTDDASEYESLFGQITLVEGNPENIKITNATDLKLASLFV